MLHSANRRPGRRARPRPRKGLLLAILVIALVAVAPRVYAMGQKEDPLKQADTLIAERNYDAAILFLTNFIQSNPDRFDEAQKRLREVIIAREAYNKTALTLIQMFKVVDPENVDDQKKILDLINELGGQYPTPNQETTAFVAKTKATATFTYNKAQYGKIFSAGGALIDQGKYAEAASTYAEGFSLYREEFDAGPYDKLTKSSVANLVERLKTEVVAFGTAQAEMTGAVGALKTAFVDADSAAAAEAWSSAEALLKDRVSRRNSVVSAGLAMARQQDTIRKQFPDSADTDASFLPFTFRFTLGRKELPADSPGGSPKPPVLEGIAGAMDKQWLGILDELQKAFETALSGEYAKGIAAYSASDWTGASTAFDNAVGLAEVGIKVLDLWNLQNPKESVAELAPYWQGVLKDKPADRARDSHLAAVSGSASRLARYLASAGTTASSAAAYASALTQDSPLALVLSTLQASRLALIDLEGKIGAEAALEAELAKQAQASDPSRTAQADLAAKVKAAQASVLANEVAVLSSALGFEHARLGAELDAQTANTAAAKLRLDGQLEGEPATLRKYPGEASTLLSAQGPGLADLVSRVSAYAKKIAAEPARVAAVPEIAAWAAKSRELDAKAAGLEKQRAELLAKAMDEKRLADAASAEADRLVADARRALSSKEFDKPLDRLNAAKDRTQRANDRYLASLAIDYSPKLDAQRIEINTELTNRIGPAAGTEVTTLINSGKSFLFQDNYAKAGEALYQARAIRKDIQGQVDAEVEFWIANVEDALSSTSGRTIDPRNPLYAEMSQLISLARTYYNQGQSLLAQKKRAEALVVLGQARDKINQVKTVFTRNQEARVLALRIDQIIDPAAFKLQFSAQFGAAQAQIRLAPSRETKATLEDLAAIDPNYPGMRQALAQINEALNPRNLLVIDPARQRDARALVVAAAAIMDSRDTARFDIALTQINQAISLDPTNAEASQRKNTLLTWLGTAAQAALSSAAEEEYRVAVNEYQAGNFILANSIVDRLLADAKNRDSQKINDLSKKIKARL